MTIEECTDAGCTERFSGSPASLDADLDRILAPDATARYRVTLAWPLAAQDPSLYGSALTGDLTWTGRTSS